MVGALLFPYAAALIVNTYLDRDVDPSVFAGRQPRCVGAFIAGLVFDGAKRLSWR